MESLICENVLQILDRGVPAPRFWRGPDQDSLAGAMENDAAEAQISVDDAFMQAPELQEFNRLLLQIDFEHQNLRKSVLRGGWFVKVF